MRLKVDVADPTGLEGIPTAISDSKRINKLAEDAAPEVVVSVNAAYSSRGKHASQPRRLLNQHGADTHSG